MMGLSSGRYSASLFAGSGLLLLSIYLLWHLLEPMLWAVILAYVTWPLYTRLTTLLGGHRQLSALLIPAIFLLVLISPLAGLGLLLQREWLQFYEELSTWLNQEPSLPPWLTNIPLLGSQLEFLLEPFASMRSLAKHYAIPWLRQTSSQVIPMLEGIGWGMARVGMTLFILFFCYRDGIRVSDEIKKASLRIFGQKMQVYGTVIESTTRAVTYGIVFTAAGQSLVAALGYWAAGLKSPLLLGLLTFALGFIPFGVVLVWGSASVYLLLTGNTWGAAILCLWGMLVVSWVDNLIRPWVISQNTRIPFLLVILGILGGLTRFGFIGLFVGPVILNLAMTAWQEWNANDHSTGES